MLLHREIHIVDEFKINAFLKIDIFEFEKNIINFEKKNAWFVYLWKFDNRIKNYVQKSMNYSRCKRNEKNNCINSFLHECFYQN